MQTYDKISVVKPPTGPHASVQELIALKAHALKPHYIRPQKTRDTAGQYLSKRRGRGLEFAELRHYQSGDDVRAIDWRVTARSGKPHTRLYAEEKEQPTYIMCDLSSSMQFGTRVRFKATQAANLAALIAWSTIARGDRAGGVIYTDNDHVEVKPSRSTKSVALYLGQIAQCSQQRETPAETLATNPTEALLTQVKRLSGHGGKVYVLSDFIGWNTHCEEQLALLCRHNDCHLVAITDPFEAQLPPTGVFPITDGRKKLVLTGRKQQQQLEASFAQRLQTLSDNCRQFRADFSHVSTADNPIFQLPQVMG